ncbi:MAG TPA: hypothetical protein VFB07_11725 [Vicinamibacterales bacterium]|nr:hypothetical protein [Vicinamibacterales bacterium]
MHARLFFAACASVALLSAGACNTTPNDRTTDQTKAAPDTAAATKGTTGADADQQKPIALTGCLQKDGGDFVLTQINEPPKGEPVAEQDVKEAEHTYRLNAKNTNDDDWAKMVGREVRISGTLAKRGDVDQKVGTSGSTESAPKIRERDLAQVDVSDIQQVAAACGGHAEKSAAKTGARNTAKPRRK